jgi:hypothetical protein
MVQLRYQHIIKGNFQKYDLLKYGTDINDGYEQSGAKTNPSPFDPVLSFFILKRID